MFNFIRTTIFSALNSICKFFLEVFVFDKQVRRILKGKLAKLYLKRYVKKALKANIEPYKNKSDGTIIWQYWDQGIENAPEIVKTCINSVEKYKNGNKHIVLNNENVKEYTDIPDYIWKLNEKGIIKNAHMSDIIRTYLLAKHGGVWVDATVLFTDNLPEYITESDLFLFQNNLRIDLDGLNMASYFIAAKPNNEIILRTKKLLEEYWIENSFLNNYFMFLHAFTMVSQASEHLKSIFNKIPYFNFVTVQQFQKELMNKYSEYRWKQIKSTSSIHKLSYKIKLINKNNKDIKGTFYEKLIQGELI